MTSKICAVCKRSLAGPHKHVLQQAVIDESAPLAFTIELPRHSEGAAIARRLGLARRELKEFFPEKEFEIQPAWLYRSGFLAGDGHIGSYAVFEK